MQWIKQQLTGIKGSEMAPLEPRRGVHNVSDG